MCFLLLSRSLLSFTPPLPILEHIHSQALITNKEVEAMQGVGEGVELVVVGGCWWQWIRQAGKRGVGAGLETGKEREASG